VNTVLKDLYAIRNHARAKNNITPILPDKLRNQLLDKLKKIMKSVSENEMMSLKTIDSIRNAFYEVLLQLFAYYNEFVRKDDYGDITFDIKRFMQISNKQYR
jgi:hypothetical protein